MIVVEPDLTLSGVESLYSKLDTPLTNDIATPLQYLFGNAFGLEAALVQLVASFYQRNPRFRYSLNCEIEDYPDYLRKAFASSSNIAAAYFANRITDESGHNIERAAALSCATDRISAMHAERFAETASTHTTALLCFRHAQHEFLPCFYDRAATGSIRAKPEMISLISRVLQRGSANTPLDNRTIGLVNSLGPLIYELIKNTDDHSLVDERGNAYRRGIRGLLVSKQIIDRENLLQVYSGSHPRLSTYLNGRLAAAGRNAASMEFIELSVIDTGPGMARRWLTHERGHPVTNLHDIDIREEREAVVTCFRKYVTTKSTGSSGMGLSAVLTHLARTRGFVRIRTGRLSLFQSFSEQESSAEFNPAHWDRDNIELPDAAGTLITLCIPSPREQNEER